MDGWMDMCLCILYVIYVYVCVYNMFKHIYTHATQHTRGLGVFLSMFRLRQGTGLALDWLREGLPCRFSSVFMRLSEHRVPLFVLPRPRPHNPEARDLLVRPKPYGLVKVPDIQS